MTGGTEMPVNCNSLTSQLTAFQTQWSIISLGIALYLNLFSHLEFCFWMLPDLAQYWFIL